MKKAYILSIGVVQDDLVDRVYLTKAKGSVFESRHPHFTELEEKLILYEFIIGVKIIQYHYIFIVYYEALSSMV